jgi:hypothetical protein
MEVLGWKVDRGVVISYRNHAGRSTAYEVYDNACNKIYEFYITDKFKCTASKYLVEMCIQWRIHTAFKYL